MDIGSFIGGLLGAVAGVLVGVPAAVSIARWFVAFWQTSPTGKNLSAAVARAFAKVTPQPEPPKPEVAHQPVKKV